VDDFERIYSTFDGVAQLREHRQRTQSFLKDLIGVLHILDRMCQFEPSEAVTAVRDRMEQALGHYGVREIPCEGEPFDPALHEADSRRVDTTVPPGTVVDALARGFKWNDELLIAPRVVVAIHDATNLKHNEEENNDNHRN